MIGKGSSGPSCCLWWVPNYPKKLTFSFSILRFQDGPNQLNVQHGIAPSPSFDGSATELQRAAQDGANADEMGQYVIDLDYSSPVPYDIESGNTMEEVLQEFSDSMTSFFTGVSSADSTIGLIRIHERVLRRCKVPKRKRRAHRSKISSTDVPRNASYGMRMVEQAINAVPAGTTQTVAPGFWDAANKSGHINAVMNKTDLETRRAGSLTVFLAHLEGVSFGEAAELLNVSSDQLQRYLCVRRSVLIIYSKR